MRNMKWTALYYMLKKIIMNRIMATAFQITGIFCHQIFESVVVVEMLRTGYLLVWRSDQPSPAQPSPARGALG